MKLESTITESLALPQRLKIWAESNTCKNIGVIRHDDKQALLSVDFPQPLKPFELTNRYTGQRLGVAICYKAHSTLFLLNSFKIFFWNAAGIVAPEQAWQIRQWRESVGRASVDKFQLSREGTFNCAPPDFVIHCDSAVFLRPAFTLCFVMVCCK